MTRLIGKQIGGYTLSKKLGQGSTGSVYLARDSQGRKVALKVLFAQYTDNSRYVDRFKREASIIKGFDHPHIVHCYEYNEDPEYGWYYVMEYHPGDTLRTLLNQAPLSISQAIDLILQLLSALHYAHQRGVIHRDIKPDNLLIANDKLIVTDFGIAQVPEGTRLTRTGFVPGTPEYMSPEQFKNEEPDPRSDIYATGIVLFEMLTGTTPFASTNLAEVIQGHVYKAPPLARDINPNIPEPLSAIIEKALKKNKDQRFTSAEEMANAIKLWFDPSQAYTLPEEKQPNLPAKRDDPTIMVAVSTPTPASWSPLWLLPLMLLLCSLTLTVTFGYYKTLPPTWYTCAIGREPVPLGGVLAAGVTWHGAQVALFFPARYTTAVQQAKATQDILLSLWWSSKLNDPGKLHTRRINNDQYEIYLEPDTTIITVDAVTARFLQAPPQTISEYWLAILQDHISLKQGVEPTYVKDYEHSHPVRSYRFQLAPLFNKIYLRCRHLTPTGPIPTSNIIEAINSLDPDARRLFREAAGLVPLTQPGNQKLR